MTIKKQILSGVKWVALAKICGQVMTLTSMVILARLLNPDDFGIFAILMIFVGFLDMFVGMGSSAAIVHIDNPSEKLLSSIFYFNIFMGSFFCVLLIALSDSISIFFENTEIKELLKWLSLTFVISSFKIVQEALFTKRIDFKILTIIGIFTDFVSLIVGIIAAIKGFGVYSLIMRALVSSILSSILIWIISSWKPKLIFSFKELKEIFNFSTNLTSFTFINYFARNADNFLIGKLLGSSSLGVYNMAYNIMLYPLLNISHVLIRVLFPAFSKLKYENEKLKKVYLRVIFFIALVSFPLMIGLMATSELFVSVMFGDKWNNLAIILFIMAPIGMMQSLVTTTGSLYMAKGNVNMMFKTGTINAIVAVSSFFVGITFGIKGVAVAYLIANIIMLYPMLAIAWKQIDLSAKEGFSEIFPILMFAILMGLGVVFLGRVVEDYIENQIIRLIVMVLSGIVIYLLLLPLKYGNPINMLNELRN